MTLTIELKLKTVNVPVFVQPDSEQCCLLGMNAIPLFGIEVRHCDGEPIVLLDKEKLPSGAVTVNLISATSVPAQTGRIVRARMSIPGALSGNEALLFEPCHDSLGINAMESLVSAEEDEIVLPVENHQRSKVHVDIGLQLGTVRCSDFVSSEADEMINEPVAYVAPVSADSTPPDRTEQLHQLLSLPIIKLSPEENDQLKELVVEFHDVFALSDAELGRTDLVEHQIDTAATISHSSCPTPKGD